MRLHPGRAARADSSIAPAVAKRFSESTFPLNREARVHSARRGDDPRGGAPAATAATDADLPYVVHLQKAHGYALGFLPRVALEEKIRLGRIWLARENGEPAGFLHHGSLATPEVRIFQAAIQYDARRRHLGLALVNGLLARAAAAGAQGVSLRCLSDLDANAFWRDAGFTLLTTEAGARGTLNVWARRLEASPAIAAPSQGEMPVAGTCTPNFIFHSRLHPCPNCGRLTYDTWTRGAVRRRLCPGCVATENDSQRD